MQCKCHKNDRCTYVGVDRLHVVCTYVRANIISLKYQLKIN